MDDFKSARLWRTGVRCLLLLGIALPFGTTFHRADGQERKIRKLAPGGETRVSLKRADEATNAEHDLIDVVVGHPELDLAPQEFESTRTR